MTITNTMQYAHFIAKRKKAHDSTAPYKTLLAWALRDAYRAIKRGESLTDEVTELKQIDRRIVAEKSVVRAIVRNAIKTGHTVSLYNGEEWAVKLSSSEREVMAEVYATDEETLKFRKDGKVIGSVYLVYGNSAGEVMADCSDCPEIESILAPAYRRMDRYATLGI